MMTVWFEGSNDIHCNIEQVKRSLENHGEHYVGVNWTFVALAIRSLSPQDRFKNFIVQMSLAIS